MTPKCDFDNAEIEKNVMSTFMQKEGDLVIETVRNALRGRFGWNFHAKGRHTAAISLGAS
jgi:hypothetical protein